MTPTLSSLSWRLVVAAVALVLSVLPAIAQPSSPDEGAPLEPAVSNRLRIRPMLGVQTMWFNGDYQANRPLSPVGDEVAALGGGMMGSSNAVHVEVEVIPAGSSMLRFPLSFDAFFLSGKTTFAGSAAGSIEPRRLTFNHTANIYSIGTGVRASFFRSPSLYLSAEARFNFIPPSELNTRLYSALTDETITERTVIIDSNSYFRVGAYMKVGTQVEFFEPLLLDFSVGYGVLNLAGKETQAGKVRDLLVIEPYDDNSFRPSSEMTLGYIGLGFGIIWKL